MFYFTSSFLFCPPSSFMQDENVIEKKSTHFSSFSKWDESQTKEATKKLKEKKRKAKLQKKLFRLFGGLIYSSSLPFNFFFSSSPFALLFAKHLRKNLRKEKQLS